MGSNEKPITDLTFSIKVQYFISITPFYDGILGAQNWDMILCSIWKESNLLDLPPQSNRSALICLPNSLSASALNSMSLSLSTYMIFLQFSMRFSYKITKIPDLKENFRIYNA